MQPLLSDLEKLGDRQQNPTSHLATMRYRPQARSEAKVCRLDRTSYTSIVFSS